MTILYPTSEYAFKGLEIGMLKRDNCTSVYTTASFIIVKIWNQCLLMDGWIQKMSYIHTLAYYAAIKNEFMSCGATWTAVEDINLDTEKQTLHSLISEAERVDFRSREQNSGYWRLGRVRGKEERDWIKVPNTAKRNTFYCSVTQ